MALIDYIPTDPIPNLRLAPAVATRRVYDRSIYSNDTPNTIAPIVQMVGFPARLVGTGQTTIYAKPYGATLLVTEVNEAKGAWYTDIIVKDDPDIVPDDVFATLTHPDWAGPETRAVPAGAGPVCWSDLELVVIP